MSPYPPPPPAGVRAQQPSLVGPILLTAFGAAMMFVLPVLIGRDLGSCCLQNCCAAVMAAALGVMPVMVLRRGGRLPSAGTGCLIGFFGVAIGGIVGAILQARFPAYDVAELRAFLEQGYAELERQSQTTGQPVPVTREVFISNAVALAPYFVILVVAFSSFLAGGVGMLVASLGGRQPPQPPYPPQAPYPPQYPPQV